MYREGPANWILGVGPPNLVKDIAFNFYIIADPTLWLYFLQKDLTTAVGLRKNSDVGGAFSWVGRSVREGWHTAWAIPFVNASIDSLLIDALTLSPSTNCFQSWSLFLQAGHRFSKLVTVFRAGSTVHESWSTIYQSRLNCLPMLIQLFTKADQLFTDTQWAV